MDLERTHIKSAAGKTDRPVQIDAKRHLSQTLVDHALCPAAGWVPKHFAGLGQAKGDAVAVEDGSQAADGPQQVAAFPKPRRGGRLISDGLWSRLILRQGGTNGQQADGKRQDG